MILLHTSTLVTTAGYRNPLYFLILSSTCMPTKLEPTFQNPLLGLQRAYFLHTKSQLLSLFLWDFYQKQMPTAKEKRERVHCFLPLEAGLSSINLPYLTFKLYAYANNMTLKFMWILTSFSFTSFPMFCHFY